MSRWIEGSPVASGATADVTRGAPGEVIKTFRPEFSRLAVQGEATGASIAYRAGVPTPRLIAVDLERRQLRFAFSEGRTLDTATFALGPRHTGTVLAELLCSVSAVVRTTTFGEETLPDVHSRLLEQIDRGEAPQDLKRAACHDLDRLPSGDRLLHLDLHLRNIMWGNEAVVIDWSNAAWGPPAADIARTRLLLNHSHFYVPRAVRPAAKAYLGRVRQRFEELLRSSSPQENEASRAWLRVFAAARFEGPVAAVEKAKILRSWESGGLEAP